ncbi:MAG TPA: DnaJ domain-containing protein [Usitatibacter sp.]|nr:DnaJ domain-containing protein [Usitatibacter sp.]
MPEAGAALVAAQLLAFYKEPVRYRARLIHGHEPFTGGMHVFRFAQGRFPNSLLRDLSPPERERLRKAANFFIRQVCFWEGATHYQLLCLAPDARRDAIKEHYHGLMGLIHPDRQEPGGEQWPADAAQRVNLAHAVLCGDDSRAAYDAGLRKARADATARDGTSPAPEHARAVHRAPRGAFLVRLRKPVLIVGAASASLFFMQVWWAGQVPGEYGVLSSATPFSLSSDWMRNAMSSSERPRFLRAEAPAATAAAISPAASIALTPLLQPVFEASRATAPVAAPPPPPPSPAGARDRSGAAALAAVPGESAASPVAPRALAQAQPVPPRPSAPEPTAEQINAFLMESLMAKLVTYYEAGDVDRLLALCDAGSIGVWEAVKLRHDFESFFRNTKARRLRLNRVSWETTGLSARARGKATLIAEHFDEPVRSERVVDIELDALLRDGQPRISRLSLYPHS